MCDEISGHVIYVSISGDIEIQSAVGAGSYKAENSGMLNITYTDAAGDLYLYNKNDDVELSLLEDLNFKFEAATKNGSVSTSFESVLSMKTTLLWGLLEFIQILQSKRKPKMEISGWTLAHPDLSINPPAHLSVTEAEAYHAYSNDSGCLDSNLVIMVKTEYTGIR
ncbi:MAG: DUF4097 domain-containing protein [Lachnospiraceae bacterium]|nr:DUF4097 domain-containing protein [Lachnospiraceae bacterium]